MLRVVKHTVSGLRFPLYSSSALAFASLGDAFLYAFLPQYGEGMGIPLVWIGILLSINRFIRILLNPFLVHFFARYGARQATMAASILAILSTMGYSLDWGLASLLFFRVTWGIAFALLRISTLAYALDHPDTGISLGAGRSLQEAGPLFALCTGPFLLSFLPAETTFLLLAIFSLPALYYAWKLPDLDFRPGPLEFIPIGRLTLFNAMTFLVSFAVDGLLIVVLGIFLSRNEAALSSQLVTSLVAACLAWRRISFILFSPVGGIIASRIGMVKVFHGSLLMIIAGLVILLLGWEPLALVIIFTFNSINSAIAPGSVTGNAGGKLKAAASNATWRDTGAALGAFAGGLFLSGSFLTWLFIITIFMLAALLYFKTRSENQP